MLHLNAIACEYVTGTIFLFIIKKPLEIRQFSEILGGMRYWKIISDFKNRCFTFLTKAIDNCVMLQQIGNRYFKTIFTPPYCKINHCKANIMIKFI